MAAVNDTGPFTNCRPFSVKDLTNNRIFLVDILCEVSVTSRDPFSLTAAQVETLRAVNGTNICTYGHRSLIHHLGLNITFR